MEAEQIVRPNIPPELVRECDAWREANRLVKKLTEQINKLSEWAEEEAEEQLTQEAYCKRDIATGVWIGLVGITLLFSIILAIRGRRTSARMTQELR
jgi:amino acid transporter